jgi:hypothetical protein
VSAGLGSDVLHAHRQVERQFLRSGGEAIERDRVLTLDLADLQFDFGTDRCYAVMPLTVSIMNSPVGA